MKRITGRRLQQIRRDHFAINPLCVECKKRNRATIATELDHIIPLNKGGLDFDRDEGTNRQGLCTECHKKKSCKDDGKTYRSKIGMDGIPKDPDHHWNR